MRRSRVRTIYLFQSVPQKILELGLPLYYVYTKKGSKFLAKHLKIEWIGESKKRKYYKMLEVVCITAGRYYKSYLLRTNGNRVRYKFIKDMEALVEVLESVGIHL